MAMSLGQWLKYWYCGYHLFHALSSASSHLSRLPVLANRAISLLHHSVGVEPAAEKDNFDISDSITPPPHGTDRQTAHICATLQNTSHMKPVTSLIWLAWKSIERWHPASMAARQKMNEEDGYSMFVTFRASLQSDTSCSSVFRIDYQLAVSAPGGNPSHRLSVVVFSHCVACVKHSHTHTHRRLGGS